MFGFEIELYQENRTYDKNTIFVCSNQQWDDAHRFINDGKKVLIEHIQEADIINSIDSDLIRYTQCLTDPNLSARHIPVPLFFWYKESLQFDYRKLPRNINPTKQFLLKMNFVRDFRDVIYEKFGDLLEDNLCSYVERGIQMPNDVVKTSRMWDRYINPKWYDDTWYSIVVETFALLGENRTFMTEKTFKPMAMKHPFMTISCVNTLKILKDNGFATFENLFDQSYDSINDLTKIDRVYKQAKNTTITGYDKLTHEQIEHNYNHFYNKELVIARFNKEFLEPLREFSEL
jgi:hypothetical protein